jgi:hypothetical protein
LTGDDFCVAPVGRNQKASILKIDIEENQALGALPRSWCPWIEDAKLVGRTALGVPNGQGGDGEPPPQMVLRPGGQTANLPNRHGAKQQAQEPRGRESSARCGACKWGQCREAACQLPARGLLVDVMASCFEPCGCWTWHCTTFLRKCCQGCHPAVVSCEALARGQNPVPHRVRACLFAGWLNTTRSRAQSK